VSSSPGVGRRINGERLVVLAWPRAILMQLAHPLVAAGVADHSSFRRGGAEAVRRLHHTIGAMRHLTFGGEAERAAALAGIMAIHRRVYGRLAVGAGAFPAGTPYSAEDPALVLWVHATLVDSLPRLYERVAAPLSDDERDRFCAEAAQVAVWLGADEPGVPRTWAALQRYLDVTVTSGAIAVSDVARALARDVIEPRLGPLARPATALTRLITIGLLPATFRDAYGLGWTDRDERRLNTALRLIGRARRLMPDRLTLWPDARTPVELDPLPG
jgi:uncharacterized protein (DUF2236 family)